MNSIKDKFLALAVVVLVLAVYVLFALKGISTTFIENALLFALGVFGGLLKSTAAPPQTNIGASDTTNIVPRADG